MSKLSVIVAFTLVLLFVSPVQVSSSQLHNKGFQPSCRVYWGPKINRIVYIPIENEEQQIRAIIDDEIDIIDHPINSSFFDILNEEDNIALETTSANSYLEFVFNCDKYPFNITAFRRAFAFALDKEKLADLWSASEIPTTRAMDTCVITDNPLSVERDLNFSYITPNIGTANNLLDNAGFIDHDSDGYRENPDNSELEIVMEYYSEDTKTMAACNEAIEVFNGIGIRTSMVFNSAGFGMRDTGYFIIPHMNFDVAFLQQDFEGLDVDWLANEYWSEYAEEWRFNKPNFRNDTYDSYRNTLLHSTNFTEVWEAALEMQRIIAYECPIVVSHELLDVYAYRTDRFENYLNEVTVGPVGWYSLCQLHLQDTLGGPFGGTFRIGTTSDIESFSIFNVDSFESGDILRLMYDSLLKRYPHGEVGPLLARNWTLETHLVNEDIPAGITRMVFDIDTSAVWTDTSFCTAEDVVFSINCYKDLEDHWLGKRLQGLSAAYVHNGDAVFEFSTESYWHLSDIAFLPIIPKHVFQEMTVEECLEYDPRPPIDPMVTIGAFNVSDHVAGEFMELTYFPNYYHLDPLEVSFRLYAGTVIEHLLDYEIRWSVNGAYRSYSIYLDGELLRSSSEYVGTESLISTGMIRVEPGQHTAELVVTDYMYMNHSNTVEFYVPATLGWWLTGIITTTSVGLVILSIYWKRIEFERLSQKLSLPIFVTILCLGIGFLFLSSMHIQSRMWGGITPGGAIWDAWGVQVFPGFYALYPIAILFLVLATLSYPLFVWIQTWKVGSISQNIRWFILISGLLLPSVFVLGEPNVIFYDANHIGWTCSRIISPTFIFVISHGGGLLSNALFAFYYVELLFPGNIMSFTIIATIYLGFGTGVAYLFYENRIISYRIFVIPIVLYILFCFYLFGADLLLLSVMSTGVPEIYVPVIGYPLGLLILAQKVKQDNSLQAKNEQDDVVSRERKSA